MYIHQWNVLQKKEEEAEGNERATEGKKLRAFICWTEKHTEKENIML